MTNTGRVTLPIEVGIDDEVKTLMQRLGADAVRNSDGTELPDLVHSLAATKNGPKPTPTPPPTCSSNPHAKPRWKQTNS